MENVNAVVAGAKDLNVLVKSINFVSKQGKKGKNYFVKVELNNGMTSDIFCEREFINLLSVLKDIHGDKYIKTKQLVEDFSETTGGLYPCVRIVLNDDSVHRFFLNRSFKAIVYALYEQQIKNKK